MQRNLARLAAGLPAMLLGAALAATPAGAAELIVNGGFEGGFASWSRVDQAGGAGSFLLQTGLLSPDSGLTVAPPPGGSTAAMADGQEPGTHVLYQDFVVPTTPTLASLSFGVYLQNQGPQYFAPNSLAFDLTGADPRNQQFRVDVIPTSAPIFSVAAADIRQSVYLTQPADPLVSGYTTVTADLSALFAANAGQTLRLRFAHVFNDDLFVAGIDDVSVATQSVPEPSSGLLIGTALLGLAARIRRRLRVVIPVAGIAVLAGLPSVHLRADTIPLAMTDPSLEASVVLNTGLAQPIGIVFLAPNDFLVLEKASGQVKRVIGGVVQPAPVLDLAVNSNSERGLLSLVLHPSFPTNPSVYIRWTESSTGADSTAVAEVPLLGNRVDRFVWNGTSLTQAENIIQLRSLQSDNIAVPQQAPTSANGGQNGNHNGGVMAFGPDGKLYLFMGDQGRRGWLQNLPTGPFTTAPQVDDTFGGPAPDNAHLTGIILRLNPDGSAPADNPFFGAGAAIGGEVGGNLQKVYSFGHRNGFGMAFDPYSGVLWESENGDDSYSELNRTVPGMNGGWIQLAGPASRLKDFKDIETNLFGRNLQQTRYPPTRLAFTTAAAMGRLLQLPGSTYVDPKLSWKYEIGPSGMAFVEGVTLGAENDGTLWFGSARGFSQVGGTGGSIYRIKITSDRLNVDVSADPRLADGVADNLFRAQKFEGTESETLIVGTGFGTTTDIKQGPDGNLYVVSITDNAIYKISRRVG